MKAGALAAVAASSAIAASLVLACSDDTPSSSGSCPNDLPSACAVAPSFAIDVAPIVRTRCGGCHTDGGVAAKNDDFSTYANIHRQRGAMLNQVYGCRMPPADAAAPTSEERQKLLMWFVCGAPDN